MGFAVQQDGHLRRRKIPTPVAFDSDPSNRLRSFGARCKHVHGGTLPGGAVKNRLPIRSEACRANASTPESELPVAGWRRSRFRKECLPPYTPAASAAKRQSRIRGEAQPAYCVLGQPVRMRPGRRRLNRRALCHYSRAGRIERTLQTLQISAHSRRQSASAGRDLLQSFADRVFQFDRQLGDQSRGRSGGPVENRFGDDGGGLSRRAPCGGHFVEAPPRKRTGRFVRPIPCRATAREHVGDRAHRSAGLVRSRLLCPLASAIHAGGLAGACDS